MSNQDLHCRNFTTKRSEPVYSNNGKLMIDTSNIDSNLNLLNDNLTRVNPTSTVSEAIPVRLMVGISGENFNPLRSIGSDLAVYIDDMNPDAVNNSGISKASLQTDANNKLDLISLETTQLSVSSNVNSIKFNTSDTAINTLNIGYSTANIDINTSNIDSKLTFGHIEDIPDALQTVIYARHKNTHNEELGALNITTGHNLCISIEDLDGVNGQKTMALSLPVVLASDHTDINTKNNSVLNVGAHNNINNDTTINFGDVSTLEADISNMRDCNVVYSDSSNASFDSVGVEVSGNGGTNWYEIGGIFPSAAIGATLRLGFTSFSVGGFDKMRIRNKSTDTNFSNVECSVFGSP
jgi:hypothetical protein